MILNKEYLLHILNRLRTASAYSAKYNVANPLWASVTVDGTEKKLLLFGRGFHFAVEVQLDLEEIPTFTVDFERLRNILINSSDEGVDLSLGREVLVIKTAGVTHKLRLLAFDFDKYKLSAPEVKFPSEGLMDELTFCSSASSTSLMDYTKYGVIITNQGFVYATDDSAIAMSELNIPNLPFTFLLQLPLVSILLSLGEIVSLAFSNEVCFLETKDDLGMKTWVKTPILPIEYNPTILQYIKSFSSDVEIGDVGTEIIKKLTITTDYSFPTADIAFNSREGYHFKSYSSQKGETVVPITNVTGALDRAVQVGLPQLRKVLRFFDKFSIDLDNLVLFGKKGIRLFAFGLGGKR